MADLKKTLKNLLTFNEPEKVERFVLRENEDEGEEKDSYKADEKDKSAKDKSDALAVKKASKLEEDSKKGKKDKDDEKGPKVSRKLAKNLEYMKKVYNIPTNSDLVIREFNFTFHDKSVEAFIILIDGMTDRTVVNQNILNPLMVLSNMAIKSKESDVGEYVKKRLIPHNQLKVTKRFEDIIDEVNFGGCGVFVDGSDVAFAADVKGWEHRGVERPNTELVLRGPQEGFTEVLRVNTALIRKILKDVDLIVESVQIGERSKTPCAILYIKDIANDSLVWEIRKRMKSIKIDYLQDSGQLEQLIEDSSILPAPQVNATERPDKTAALLSEGKVAVIVHGSPFAMVMPTTLPTLIHSPEDSYVRFPFANFLRAVRYLGILMALLLPGIYIAITNFHHEMIPTDLLFAINAAREVVPFPSIVEIMIMEISFELIREAGIRIPGPIGPTLGIIGALILGQAAVAANIVSPILIIVVAVTGIGSFAIPNFSLAFGIRMLRFGYIILGALAGFLGITTGIFIHGLWLVSAKSFGVPFLVPLAPKTAGGFGDVFARSPTWKQEDRPDFLNTKDRRKQPHISRKWTKENED